MVDDMLDWLRDTAADEVARLERRRYAQYLYQLDSLSRQFNAEQEAYQHGDSSDDDNDYDEKGCPRNRAREVMSDFVEYQEQLTVVGFNSSNYDLPLIKPYLARNLMGEDPNAMIPKDSDDEDGDLSGDSEGADELLYCCQKGNSVIKLCTKRLVFTDKTKFLTPGTSYSR